jgi:methionine synthase I (cobalamin-dependent)
MNRLLNWLERGPLITDGAWGTELQRKGLPVNETPDAWNLTHPSDVLSVARSYVDAGSAIILTNTFRANSAAMPDADIAAINREGARLSLLAASGRAKVAGTIGPASTAAGSSYALQAEALAQSGVDLFLLETFTDLDDASAALAATRHAGLPAIVSFAFHRHLPPETAAPRMEREGAAGIGANCAAIDEVAAHCVRLRDSCDLPIWAKPNAGTPRAGTTGYLYPDSPDAFAAGLQTLLDAGACFVGGCCGATPGHIHALVSEMRRSVAAT